MCGIVYVEHKKAKQIRRALWQAYEYQSNRGSEGYGAVYIENSKAKVIRAEQEGGIKKQIDKLDTSCMLFHHRYPTSTPNFKEVTHPILVQHKSFSYDYYIVHNGVITNTEELYDKHIAMGFVYNTLIEKKYIVGGVSYSEYMFNDSECIAIELALFLEGKQTTIDSEGSASVVIMQVTKNKSKPVALYYGTNGGNPLKVDHTRNILTISSENASPTAIDCIPNILYSKVYETNATSTTNVKIGTCYIPKVYHSTMGYNTKDMEEGDFQYPPIKWNNINEDTCDTGEEWSELVDDLEICEVQIKNAHLCGDYDALFFYEGEKADLESRIAFLESKIYGTNNKGGIPF